jgi:CubicO group peptidase (beta-lactamase class C family)
VFGSCDERFDAVRAALLGNFEQHGELGAAVAIALDGRLVVDLWAGWMDGAREQPWRRDTLVNVFSVGKAVAVLALLMLVEAGRIELDARVARYWPAFSAGGKGDVTVRMLLAHRAGVPGVRRALPELAMYDWDGMAAVLAEEAPWWEPGRFHGYHVNTFGFLVGELVRRTSGETIGAFVRRAVTGPLGADFHFGIGPEHDPRVAEYVFAGERFGADPLETGDDEERRDFLRCIYFNPAGISGMGTVNTRAWRAAEMPSTNGHATARAVARIYGALARGGAVDGIRLVASDTIEQAITEESTGNDVVLRRPSRFGLGFQLNRDDRPLGPGDRTFGHFGAGGSLGFADPDRRLAFAYVMNRAGPRQQNPRVRGLIDATYASL